MAKNGYQFDTVVLVYCLNDVADIIPEWQTILQRMTTMLYKFAEIFSNQFLHRKNSFWNVKILRNRYMILKNCIT